MCLLPYLQTVRFTERGERASEESQSGTTEMCRIYSEALGFSISRTETPAIYNLMSRSYHTAEQTSKNPKEKYMRIRPVVRFNEIPTGRADRLESLRTSGSYPSGHTTRGMATALVLAEMAPEYQDTILRRGFEYGESRVIVFSMIPSRAVTTVHVRPTYTVWLRYQTISSTSA